jgi:hypothetical protein
MNIYDAPTVETAGHAANLAPVKIAFLVRKQSDALSCDSTNF